MYLHILQRDLKRKKTMNVIMLLFIILAAMFVASGLNNVITVMNGTDYYLNEAGVGDVNIITMGADATGHMKEYLDDNESVKDYKIETVICGARDNIILDGEETAYVRNTCMFMKISDRKLNYYDKDNQIVNEVAQGHIYATGKFMEKNNLKPGDTIIIKHSGFEKKFIIDGELKDALLGSDFMGNTRFFMSDEDYNEMLSDESIRAYYQGEIGYVNLKGDASLSDLSANLPGIAFDGNKSTIKMCYAIDMIVAFLIIVLSVCLMIVSFVVLKFSINFSIQEEYREIGVMKAIGIKNASIRGMYISKYLALSVIGAILGFIFSIPFGNMLMKSVSDNMLLGNNLGLMPNLTGVVSVVILTIAFAYSCTGKIEKATPIDAIRSGQTGERYKKKTIYRIGKSHANSNLYMALNDLLSSPKRFTTIIVSFCICTLFLLIIVNTVETMDSDKLVSTFGMRLDLYMTDVSAAMEYMNAHTRDDFKEYLATCERELADLGMPATAYAEVQYKYEINCDGKKYTYTCQQGINTTSKGYIYTKGTAPSSKNEIAITPQVSEKTGAKIGDVITIDFGTEKLDCVVVAYFETMNQLGEIIRLHEDAPTDFKYVSSILQTQFNFTDNPDQKEINRRRDELKKYYDNEEVMNASEYCADSVGVVPVMQAVERLLIGITLVVIVFVTILMERSFISDEKSQIAILKAIGFRNRDVISWQVYRLSIVALTAAILGGILSYPMTKLCITPIFGMMGTTDFEYNIVPWKVFLFYPGMVVVTTAIIAFITAQYTRTITSKDTANIE